MSKTKKGMIFIEGGSLKNVKSNKKKIYLMFQILFYRILNIGSQINLQTAVITGDCWKS